MGLLGCDDVTGLRPPRERGRPARTTLAQLHPSSRPGSTSNGVTIPLQPSPWGSRRQGDRAPHQGETERPPNAVHAGETPALPEGRLLPSFLLGEEALPLPMRRSRSAWCVFSETLDRQSRRTMNEHKDRWTCLAAATSRRAPLPWAFVDYSFSVCFQIVLDASIQSLSTDHYSLSTQPRPHPKRRGGGAAMLYCRVEAKRVW